MQRLYNVLCRWNGYAGIGKRRIHKPLVDINDIAYFYFILELLRRMVSHKQNMTFSIGLYRGMLHSLHSTRSRVTVNNPFPLRRYFHI